MQCAQKLDIEEVSKWTQMHAQIFRYFLAIQKSSEVWQTNKSKRDLQNDINITWTSSAVLLPTNDHVNETCKEAVDLNWRPM